MMSENAWSAHAANSAQEILYQKRIPIYPRSVKGRFRTFKYVILAIAFGVYFLLPWLRWERANAPDQAVLFDIPGRHFYIFNLIVDVQDLFWLSGILIIAAMLLFFVTTLAGRVFCGYFCFQTLWTDAFMLIEHWIQGERPARMRLAQAPWHREKILKMTATYGAWLLLAVATGVTFTLYWMDAPTLVTQMIHGTAPYAAYATVLLLTTTTFVMAGLMREQVCLYMCPYARFQSVMLDKDTFIVAYDALRGERTQGRHKAAPGLRTAAERQAQGVGDCVDCGYCVQVCPTGIDIRQGLQLGCISCGLCIDACDTVMDRLHQPRGLIKYTSENNQSGGRTRLLKLRTVGYGAILVIALGILGWSILHRAPYNASVVQVRQPLFVKLSDGRIQNAYEIKLNNKLTQPMTVNITIAGLANAELEIAGIVNDTLTLQPQQRLQLLAKVRVPTTALTDQQQHLEFVITPVNSVHEPIVRRPVLFYQAE